MNDVADFFKKLLDTSDWPPRWHCGTWTDFHGWLTIISDLLIWASYFAIPVIIIRYLSKRKLERFMPLYILFATFILACGTTHFLDAVVFWHPLYRLATLVKLITGIVSAITAVYLIKLLPYAFSLKSPQALQSEIEMRKKIEEELQYKNEQMEEAEIVGNFGSYEWNIQTGEFLLSKGMKYLLAEPGLSSITYENFLEMVLKQERAAEDQLLSNCVADKKFKSHYQHLSTKNGEKILFTRAKEIMDEDGNLVKFIGTSHDVTEIRKNKELLEESRKTFQNAFEYSSVGIALVDTHGRWLDMNDAASEMLGYSKEELQTKTFRDITYEDDLEEDVEQVKKMLSKEISSYRMQKRYVKKNGDIVWALLSVSLVWQNNRPKFFISQIVDITLQKTLMDDLTQKNQELTNANKKLQYHVEQVSEFNRIIAHNLRGPATSLINLADFIMLSDNEEDKKFLLSQVKEVSHAIIITLNDLKEFIEIYINKEITPRPASLELAIQRGMQLLRQQIKSTQAVINYNLEVDKVIFPQAYLDSILYNLISNAIKYIHGTTIPVIHINCSMKENLIELRVSDNGIGVDLGKHRGEIFKYKKVFHKGYDSNGMGLFLTKNQLEAYGAKIEVDSQVNVGSTFTITFE